MGDQQMILPQLEYQPSVRRQRRSTPMAVNRSLAVNRSTETSVARCCISYLLMFLGWLIRCLGRNNWGVEVVIYWSI